MATGDAALAAGMDVVDPATDLVRDGADAINYTRDQIAQRTNAVTPVAKGGTGATNAAAARTNLDVPSVASTVENGVAGTRIRLTFQSGTGRVRVRTGPTDRGDIAYVADVDAARSDAAAAAGGRVAKSGDTMTGNLDVPNLGVAGNIFNGGATPATSGWTVAYFNSDGRLSKGASSEAYKKFISRIDPESMGNVFPDLYRYQMRRGDGSWRYGWIAQRLAEDPDLQRFVVYNADGEPESIDFISLLIVQNAELHRRLRAIEDGA